MRNQPAGIDLKSSSTTAAVPYPPGSVRVTSNNRVRGLRHRLRHDARDRQAYAVLKQSLAQRDWQDMNAYASAKGPLIEQITARAEKWAAQGAWRGLLEES